MVNTTKINREHAQARDILTTFGQYGFRKTSMEDIGRAAGVSRQSIYKKFGSKERCYEWTLHTYLADLYTRIFSILSQDNPAPLQTLVRVFDILIGEAVDIVSNPHGPQVYNDALKATHASEEDWPLRLKTRLAEFLKRHRLVSSDKAAGVAYALISASKGLLLEEDTREDFLKNMTLIIKSVLHFEHH